MTLSIGVVLLCAVITREFRFLNYVEAALWIALGGASALLGLIQYRGTIRRELLVLSVALVAFGFSDIVETQTGAWWRPWWLLAWKAACVVVMLALLVRYIRRRLG